MIAFSNCKINIGLDILSKRPDGYHNISTIMVPVAWHDIIEILPAKGSKSSLVVLGNKIDCPPEKNLVMKAYEKMREAYNLPPVDIVLQKIVPDGAGLGGGSADAATTIRTLNTMFSIGASKSQMASIASEIGADCPFFIYDEPMLCTGTGTEMRPISLNLEGLHLLIAKPTTASISTKQAYAGVKPCIPDLPLEEKILLPVNEWQGIIKNDFYESVSALAPEIRITYNIMQASGAIYTSMSGSGAAIYGLFDDVKMTENAKRQLSQCTIFPS